MAKTMKVRTCKGYNAPVLHCVGDLSENEFYNSWSKFYDDKVPYCKKCLQKIFDRYKRETNSDKVAAYYTLMKIDTPLISEIYDRVIEKKGGFNLSTYMSDLQRKVINRDIWSDFSATDIDIKIEQNNENVKEVNSDKKENLNNLIKMWGIQDNLEDYEFLNEVYDRYTKDIEFTNPQQEDLYKDLCRDRLLLRKINDNRYSGDETLDKVQNRISKTMSTLKLDQFEKKQNKTDIEKILERQIWEIENTEPAEVVDKNEYKDFLNIESEWGNHILRALKNLITGSKDYPKISKDD